MKRVVVIGLGVMGRGIVQCLAEAGIKTVAADDPLKNPLFPNAVKQNILVSAFQRLDLEGNFIHRSRESIKKVMNNIEFCDTSSDYFKAALGSSDAIIEVIVEDAEEKIKLYKHIERYARPNTPIFTNTSTIGIGYLAINLQHPQRFAGLHFFNPVPAMPVIECILHRKTLHDHDLNIEKDAIKIAHALQKHICWAPDLPGFIVNRLVVRKVIALNKEIKAGEDFKKIDKAFTGGTWPNYPPARRIVDEYLKAAEELISKDEAHKLLGMPEDKFRHNVDELMKLATAAPKGPFELIQLLAKNEAERIQFKMGPAAFTDLVGLDVALHCCKMLKLQEPDKWEVPEILEKMLAEGKRGRKSSEGFYTYKEIKAAAKFEMAPDKSYAKIGWTGKTLPLRVVKELKEKFDLAKSNSIPKIIFEINRSRGADINEFIPALLNEKDARYAINIWHTTIRAIMDYPGIVIVAIKGSAYGGGYEMALAGDYIVAEKKAKIGLVEVKRGIMPGGGGTQTLTRRVGPKNALRMILRGATLEELGEEVGPPWVDEAVDKMTEEKIKELIKKNIPTRSRDAMRFTFWDKMQELKETIAAKMFWKGKPPASFALARKAIWNGNQKSILFGMSKDEFDAIVAAFATEGAFTKIIDFFEGRTKKNKEEKGDV